MLMTATLWRIWNNPCWWWYHIWYTFFKLVEKFFLSVITITGIFFVYFCFEFYSQIIFDDFLFVRDFKRMSFTGVSNEIFFIVPEAREYINNTVLEMNLFTQYLEAVDNSTRFIYITAYFFQCYAMNLQWLISIHNFVHWKKLKKYAENSIMSRFIRNIMRVYVYCIQWEVCLM